MEISLGKLTKCLSDTIVMHHWKVEIVVCDITAAPPPPPLCFTDKGTDLTWMQIEYNIEITGYLSVTAMSTGLSAS